jgi:hypothetical protein
VIPVVVGSSPIGHPIRFKQKAQFKRLGFFVLQMHFSPSSYIAVLPTLGRIFFPTPIQSDAPG